MTSIYTPTALPAFAKTLKIHGRRFISAWQVFLVLMEQGKKKNCAGWVILLHLEVTDLKVNCSNSLMLSYKNRNILHVNSKSDYSTVTSVRLAAYGLTVGIQDQWHFQFHSCFGVSLVSVGTEDVNRYEDEMFLLYKHLCTQKHIHPFKVIIHQDSKASNIHPLQVCKFVKIWIPVKTSSQRKYTCQNIHRSSCAKIPNPAKINLAAGHPSMPLCMLVLQFCKMQLNTYIFWGGGLFWKNNIQTWDPSHKVVPAISACNIILNLTPYSVCSHTVVRVEPKRRRKKSRFFFGGG